MKKPEETKREMRGHEMISGYMRRHEDMKNNDETNRDMRGHEKT